MNIYLHTVHKITKYKMSDRMIASLIFCSWLQKNQKFSNKHLMNNLHSRTNNKQRLPLRYETVFERFICQSVLRRK